MIQPSFVRKTSDGADVWPRFSVAMRLTWITCCSTSAEFVERHRRAQERRFDFLPAPGLASRDQRRQRAERGERRRAEVDPRDRRAHRLLRRPGEIRGAAHDLADAVEAVLVTPRPAGAERRDGREDDVGLHPAQALEVERQRAQHLGRKVRDHDVRGRHQLLHDLATLGCAGSSVIARLFRFIARYSAPAPSAATGATQRSSPPLAPLDADHVRAEVGQQRGAVRPRDVPTEVEDPDAMKHTAQRALRLGHVDLLFGSASSVEGIIVEDWSWRFHNRRKDADTASSTCALKAWPANLNTRPTLPPKRNGPSCSRRGVPVSCASAR